MESWHGSRISHDPLLVPKSSWQLQAWVSSVLFWHMAGNLLIFTGTPDAINAYAQGLKDRGPLLWVARIGLIVFAVLHIASFLRLNARNSAARPQGYAQTNGSKLP